jgi:carbonic anhydrase
MLFANCFVIFTLCFSRKFAYTSILFTRNFNGIIIILFFIKNLIGVTNEADWNYESQGPDVWIHQYAACSGLSQSPINLITQNTIFDSSLSPVNFLNYDALLTWNVTNTGRTCESSHHKIFEKE